MNLKQALDHARKILVHNRVEDASFEAELLLRHVLDISRAQLYAAPDREMNASQKEEYLDIIERRSQGEPSAYIIGTREFYGLDFLVDRNVLIPRPESEFLVEKVIDLYNKLSISTIAEVGTGCGAIAISLARHLPAVKIYAIDISATAIEVARSNCAKHGLTDRIVLLHGDMLNPISGAVDLIVANLPYVRKADLPRTGPLSYEPGSALDGGVDGVNEIIKLCHQVGAKLTSHGCLVLEIGQGQGNTVSGFLKDTFPSANIEITLDYAGIERVLSMCLTRY